MNHAFKTDELKRERIDYDSMVEHHVSLLGRNDDGTWKVVGSFFPIQEAV